MDAFGGTAAFGRVLGKGQSTASEMKRRGSIPVAHWPRIIMAARECGIAGVTPDLLMRLHEPEASSQISPTERAA
ncbi:carph-isopro domain-containing protein [Paracoccus sp. (in: a-proteobacteria)]|uniref:carph-isopro domain-containing protein n=1 Tax=Paracoccus sp. TaxID=267 RepID=UPI003A520C31